MLTLWIVRHGQTDWNLSGRIQGWTDIPLNATGKQQARQLCEYISGIPFHRIYSSDLKRASETARILTVYPGVKMSINTDLRERCFGQGEGMVREVLDDQFAANPPGSESLADLQARGAHFLEHITKEYPYGRCLCVTHGGTIRSMLEHLGMNCVPTLGNTSVTVLQHTERQWSIRCVNWLLPALQKRGPSQTAETSGEKQLIW